jgi:hypothetical protein
MLAMYSRGSPKPARHPNSISVVDLTGIAAEDIAIAGVLSALLRV